jgi:hypothetical protein
MGTRFFDEGMSPMGKIAQRFVTDPRISSGYVEGPPNLKSEMGVATDSSGQHVIIAFNDPRGFSQTPISTSGFMVSDDGGATFLDGGQLPIKDTSSENGEAPPQIFGHPDVKYCGGSTFIYSSLMVRPVTDEGSVQSLCVYRSTDYGHTWEGPAIVSPSVDPSGAADKEFIDVDSETGRVLMSWTNFHGSETEICSSYCDDLFTSNNPTWSKKEVLNHGSTKLSNGAIPRFGPDGTAYVAWCENERNSPNKNLCMCVSHDRGKTWNGPQKLRPSSFLGMDQVVGSDSGNSYPSIAVDNSNGPHRGSVYFVYADNSAGDGSDVVFQKKTSTGIASPISLSSRPGQDRAQWFPSVAVDNQTGRIHVFYFDQSVSDSGDLTQAVHMSSDDGGETWTSPSPVLEKPFHCAYGSNAAFPNLGEYNSVAAQSGDILCALPARSRADLTNDLAIRSRTPLTDIKFFRGSEARIPVSVETVKTLESHGGSIITPGDTATISVSLRDTVTNPLLKPYHISNLSGHLSTNTEGVILVRSTSVFPEITRGGTATNSTVFSVEISPKHRCGDVIEFSLDLTSDQGTASTTFALTLGEVHTAPIFSESFNEKEDLPNGWTPVKIAGSGGGGWRIKKGGMGSIGQGLYHSEGAEETESHSSIEGVLSPPIKVPKNAQFTQVQFDLYYNTAEDSLLKVLAFNGMTLRIIDVANPDSPELLDAVAETITTEGPTKTINGFPKHLPQSADPDYLQNVSVWGGRSKGVQHITAMLPSLAGRTIRLRWDYTISGAAPEATCAAGESGMIIANVKVNSIDYVLPTNEIVAEPVAYTVGENNPLKVVGPGVMANSRLTGHAGVRATLKSEPHHGHVSVGDDGAFTYQPLPHYTGPDSFMFTLIDQLGTPHDSRANLLVSPGPSKWQIDNKIFGGSKASAVLLLTSPAPPDGMTVEIQSSNPEAAKVPYELHVPGSSNKAELELVTKPVRTDSLVTLTATANGNKTFGTFTITAHRALAAQDFSFTLVENNVLHVEGGRLLGNHSQDESKPQCRALSLPKGGTLIFNSDGAFLYTPKPGFRGSDRFTYRLISGENTSAPATVQLDVLPTIRSVIVSSTVIGGYSTEASLLLTGVAPYGGILAHLKSSRPDVASIPSTAIVSQSGTSVHFSVSTRRVEKAVPVTLTTVLQGQSRTTTFTVSPYTPPILSNLTYQAEQGEKLTLSAPGVLSRFSDERGADINRVRAWQASSPKHGAVKLDAAGGFTYVPSMDFVGEDAFTFRVTDGVGLSNIATVTIRVTPSLELFSIDKLELVSGQTANANVRLGSGNHADTVRVALDATDSGLVMPSSAVLPGSVREVAFTITAPVVTAAKSFYITAKLGTFRKTVLVIVRPAQEPAAPNINQVVNPLFHLF